VALTWASCHRGSASHQLTGDTVISANQSNFVGGSTLGDMRVRIMKPLKQWPGGVIWLSGVNGEMAKSTNALARELAQ